MSGKPLFPLAYQLAQLIKVWDPRMPNLSMNKPNKRLIINGILGL